MLSIFDANPQTYKDWAKEYFETDIPLEIITKIYDGEAITKDMVLAINKNFNDWRQFNIRYIRWY